MRASTIRFSRSVRLASAESSSSRTRLTVWVRATVSRVREELDSALASLTVREKRIVEARILAEDPCTLEALGREMGVSKERVRQLEVRARQKLREKLEHLRPAA